MNTLFASTAPITSLLGRILIAAMFVVAGLNKAGNYSGTAGYFESLGLPGALTPVVIALEVIGGLAIIVGWQTRLFALLLAGFTILASFAAHSDFSNQIEMLMFMKNVSVAGGFLFLVANGAGTLSLDHKFSKV